VERTQTSAAILGVFDGAVSAIGAVVGLLAAHAPPATILTTTAGLSVAAAVGMAGGDWLSGSRKATAAVMALATLLGSLAPALPAAILPAPYNTALALAVVAAIGAAIAELRHRAGQPHGHAYATTGLILLAASALSAAVAVLCGAIG
jgi:VIT1/CCC1 family predicted Fe2+/Mn2+ transporter